MHWEACREEGWGEKVTCRAFIPVPADKKPEIAESYSLIEKTFHPDTWAICKKFVRNCRASKFPQHF